MVGHENALTCAYESSDQNPHHDQRNLFKATPPQAPEARDDVLLHKRLVIRQGTAADTALRFGRTKQGTEVPIVQSCISYGKLGHHH